MSNQVQGHVDAELYIEYCFGFLILFVRLAGRTVLYGFGGLAWDDLCTFVTMVRIRRPLSRLSRTSSPDKVIVSDGRVLQFFWTSELAILVNMDDYGNSIGLTEEELLLLDDVTKHDYRIGDKLHFASWMAYIVLIWSMKGIIIFNYDRLVCPVHSFTGAVVS